VSRIEIIGPAGFHEPGHLHSRISGTIKADELHIGYGVTVEPGAFIQGKKVTLGDFCYIGHSVRVLVDDFEIGDYSKLHAFSFAHGDQPMRIGSCCWIGGNVVLDSIGGLTIGNGVGIGSHSHLWTHMKFGDIVQGCRFNGHKPTVIEEDAWLVGHCLCNPVRVGTRSLALLGSVITKDIPADRIFAGSPAADITDKFGGPQFLPLSRAGKNIRLQQIVDDFEHRHPEFKGMAPEMDVTRRTYRRTYSEAEVCFMRENVPLVKFYPEPCEVQEP
jgi:acetyltransferase-like isoleucine patch superfamily enzyme